MPAGWLALSSTLSVAGALALMSVGFAGEARAQFHGVSVAKTCDSPKCVGEKTDCDVAIGYNDDYGDTIEVLEAWDTIDPQGLSIRVPAAGDLDIEFVYTVTNTGPVTVGNITVTDFLGDVPGSPIAALDPNEAVTLMRTEFLTDATTNTVTATGETGSSTCEASDSLTVPLCDGEANAETDGDATGDASDPAGTPEKKDRDSGDGDDNGVAGDKGSNAPDDGLPSRPADGDATDSAGTPEKKDRDSGDGDDNGVPGDKGSNASDDGDGDVPDDTSDDVMSQVMPSCGSIGGTIPLMSIVGLVGLRMRRSTR